MIVKRSLHVDERRKSMALQPVTLKLPPTLYRRLARVAALTNQSIDAVLLQTIRGNLPVALEDTPPDMQAEIAALVKLNDDDLWAVARIPLDMSQWKRHQSLLRRNAAGSLDEKGQRELARLREATDRQVMRRSLALALLKWRGYTITLGDVPAHGAA
jgi:hypothetical protein